MRRMPRLWRCWPAPPTNSPSTPPCSQIGSPLSRATRSSVRRACWPGGWRTAAGLHTVTIATFFSAWSGVPRGDPRGRSGFGAMPMAAALGWAVSVWILSWRDGAWRH
ncbi:MAG: hypothetical protein AMJ69_05955 [Gammaproteobacteria bacterium SG8_47]|nr:MAG: hypothetical protein AMJ69_05955 [Gammaproteobacteria bacterium SG8_47]